MKSTVKYLVTFYVTLLCFLMDPGAHASVVDCRGETGVVGRAICVTPELRELNAQVNKAYRRLQDQAGRAWERCLQQSQQEWLHVRDAGVTPQMSSQMTIRTLHDFMLARLAVLQQALVSRRGVRVLRVDRVVSQRVGEGLRKYAGNRDQVVQTHILYYVLDDIPGASSFNAFMNLHYPLQADHSRPADSESDIIADLHFVDPQLISLSVSNSSFFFGAAHPMVRIEQVNYLLEAERRLRESDLFASRECEAILLARSAKAFLRAGVEPQTSTAEEIRLVVLDPTNWVLSTRGLGMVIPPDTLFSHAEGTLEIPPVPWPVLHGCLTPWAQKIFGSHA